MTNLQKGLIGAGAVVVIAGIVVASILAKPSAKGEEVYMAKAARGDLSSAVTASGKIEARTKVNVQSQVIGQIVGLPVKEGDTVKKGDLLVQIDPERYRQEVERLDAIVRMQKIAIEQAEVALAQQRRTLKRHVDLYKNGGYVSQEMLEKSQLDVESSEINLRSLKEQVSQADASLLQARDGLAKTTIRSPIDGTVTQLNAEKGETTLTGTMNNPGTVIMVVSDMGEILATVDVDETRVVQVHPGQKSRVVVDAVGEAAPYWGKVAEIAGTGITRQGQSTQIFPVKIALDQVDAKLRPGMTAKARIETNQAAGAITVPIQAVLLRPRKEVDAALAPKDGKDKDAKGKDSKQDAKPSPSPTPSPAPAAVASTASSSPASSPATSPAPSPAASKAKDGDNVEVVFRVIDGKAVLTPVKTGISDETSVAILEGIKEGDTVVTGPYRSVKDLKHNDPVREKTETAKGKSDSREGGVEVSVD